MDRLLFFGGASQVIPFWCLNLDGCTVVTPLLLTTIFHVPIVRILTVSLISSNNFVIFQTCILQMLQFLWFDSWNPEILKICNFCSNFSSNYFIRCLKYTLEGNFSSFLSKITFLILHISSLSLWSDWFALCLHLFSLLLHQLLLSSISVFFLYQHFWHYW